MKRILLATLLLASGAALAADNATLITPCASSCVTMRARDVGAGVQSMIQILGDTSGNPIYGTAGTANANILSVQGIASMTPLLATVTNGGTFATQATQAGTWTVQPGNTANTTAWLVTGTGGTFPAVLGAETTKVIGTVRNLGNAGAVVDAATGAAVPANAWYIGMAQGGNLTGLTGTSGNLNVQCANCSGSGVSTADAATFTAGTSLFAGTGGFFQTTATNNALTNGQQGMWQMTANRAGFVNLRNAAGTEVGTSTTPLVNNVSQWAGVALGAMANYGTSPGAVAVPGVNAFVTNSNANGQATMANSSPVVIASNQASIPVASTLTAETTKVIGTVRVQGNVGGVFDAATGAAPPANAIYVGALTSGATGGLMQPLIQCDQKAIYDASTNGSTELVALTSGRSIYICGKTIFAGGTVNVKLIYGTGTACATGATNLTPAYQLTAQVGLVEAVSFFRGSKTASANALCINTSAGVAVQAEVYYAVL